MAENKKYYWLKIKEDWFEDDTIGWIEDQPNGKEYSLFYLKLCLKSLRSNGILIRVVGEMLVPYDAKKLAEMTKTDFDTVVVAMELFKKIGLIQILENGEIYLTQLNEMVGSETDKAIIMRKKRALDKLNGNNVTELLPNRYPEIDKEKENRDKDIELEKEKEEENKKKVTYVSMINDYTDNPQLVSELKEYVEMRKKMKGFTTHALKINLNTLSKLTDDDDTKIAIVKQSIGSTWKSFYPLKKQEDSDAKKEHLENLIMRYKMYDNANMVDEMAKIRQLYYDLTNRDIEDAIKEN